MRILGHGLSGTAMPTFRLLSERERTRPGGDAR